MPTTDAPHTDLIYLEGPPCFLHKARHLRVVPLDAYAEYERREGDMLLQEAFPMISTDSREVLITGTCPAAWDLLWAGEED